MIDFFRSACLALRRGASLDPEVLAGVRVELQGRLAQAALPELLADLEGTLRRALQELIDVVDGLELASREEAPELAGWLGLRAQDAWEYLLAVDQQVAQHYEQLDEELHHGHR